MLKRGKIARKLKKPARARPPRRAASRLPPGVTYESERDGFIAAMRDDESALWSRGRHWHNITSLKLWRSAYKSPRAFLEAELGGREIPIPKTSELSNWAAVAKTFSEDVTRQVTMERLERALTYWRRKGINFNKLDPGSEPIEVPVDGAITMKPLLQCTIADLKAANAALGGKHTGGGLSPADAALEKTLATAVSKAAGGQASAASFQLKAKGGQTVAHLDVPLARLKAAIEALRPLL
jgi:hypothetical protein